MARKRLATYAKCACGVRFRKWTDWQTACSSKCRQKAYRKRIKNRVLQASVTHSGKRPETGIFGHFSSVPQSIFKGMYP
jgi:hypothetical protein